MLRTSLGRKYKQNKVFSMNIEIIYNVTFSIVISNNGSWKLRQQEIVTKASRALIELRKFIDIRTIQHTIGKFRVWTGVKKN